MVTGSVTVRERSTLELQGTVRENVTLLEHSIARIDGTVHGNVVNEGGRLDIFGTVRGSVIHRAGQSRIHPNAVIVGSVSDGVEEV
jgi:hypothetical protein